MKTLSAALWAPLLVVTLSSANAADIAAGRERAEACGACHGLDGVSVSTKIPNLAGQKVDYLVAQLMAFRAGKRKNPIMNAIAARLSDEEIANVAAYWNSLPGASGAAVSEMSPVINTTRVRFPESYRQSFTLYTTINFADQKQVRKYYANEAALRAAREGRPMPDGAVLFVEVYAAKLDADQMPVAGADGVFEAGKLLFYTAMEQRAGWGKEIPDLYRNGDWNYAVFTGERQLRPGVNQALCFACHKPKAEESYLFTLAELAAKAKP